MNTRKWFGAVIAFVVMGLVGTSVLAPRSVHAATAGSLPASQVLGSETASLVKQTLDAVQLLLNSMQFRLNDTTHPMSDGEKVAMNNVLDGIRASLLQINSTINALDAKAVVAANQQNASQVAGAGIGTGAGTSAGAGSAAGTPGTITPAPQGSGSEIVIGENGQVVASADTKKNDIAVVSSVFGGNKELLWGFIALVVLIAGVILVPRLRGRDNGSRAGALTAKEPAEPITQPIAQSAQPSASETPSTEPVDAEVHVA